MGSSLVLLGCGADHGPYGDEFWGGACTFADVPTIQNVEPPEPPPVSSYSSRFTPLPSPSPRPSPPSAQESGTAGDTAVAYVVARDSLDSAEPDEQHWQRVQPFLADPNRDHQREYTIAAWQHWKDTPTTIMATARVTNVERRSDGGLHVAVRILQRVHFWMAYRSVRYLGRYDVSMVQSGGKDLVAGYSGSSGGPC